MPFNRGPPLSLSKIILQKSRLFLYLGLPKYRRLILIPAAPRLKVIASKLSEPKGLFLKRLVNSRPIPGE